MGSSVRYYIEILFALYNFCSRGRGKQAVHHTTYRDVNLFISDSAAGMVPTMLLPGKCLLGKWVDGRLLGGSCKKVQFEESSSGAPPFFSTHLTYMYVIAFDVHVCDMPIGAFDRAVVSSAPASMRTTKRPGGLAQAPGGQVDSHARTRMDPAGCCCSYTMQDLK